MCCLIEPEWDMIRIEGPDSVIGVLKVLEPDAGKLARPVLRGGSHSNVTFLPDTCNLFVFLQPLKGWRHVKVTKRRTKKDFAECMKELVDDYFPKAKQIRLVMDNLNTHTMGALYERYEPEEARRIIQKIRVHHTPKHGSWLNMAEVEISALTRECLNRRLSSQEIVERELQTCVKNRNERKASVAWGFFSKEARVKMKRLYV